MVKISIIVPVYNVEKYVEKCIKSILKQKFTDFELILVNDGSTDSSGGICRKYAEIDTRIKVVEKENGGLSSARNSGLEIATGEYIGFVDSDDWVACDMYNELYKLGEKYDADIVQCSFTKAFLDETKMKKKDKKIVSVLSNIEALNNLYNSNFIETVVVWNKIYKKYLFDNIIFPVGKLHEDEFTTHKLLYKANRVVNVNSDFYFYRQTQNSIMNSEFNIRRFDRLGALRERYEFFYKNNEIELSNKTLKKYVFVAKDYYYKYENSSNYDKKLLVDIKKGYSVMFRKYLSKNMFKIKGNVMNGIFMMNPSLHKKIKK